MARVSKEWLCPGEYASGLLIGKIMKTYADTFKDKIIGLSEEELQNLRDSSFDKIEVYRERLAIVSNDKKVHDLTVSIRRKKIEIREINKLLKQCHTT